MLHTAATEFKVDPKRVKEWCKQNESLIQLKKKRGMLKGKHLKGVGRKVIDKEMEESLFSWIALMRGSNLRVSRRMIKAKALELSNTEGFKASNGWLMKFMLACHYVARHQYANLSLKITSPSLRTLLLDSREFKSKTNIKIQVLLLCSLLDGHAIQSYCGSCWCSVNYSHVH